MITSTASGFSSLTEMHNPHVQLLVSGLAGIIMCKIVYNIANMVSAHYEFYIKLNHREKVEWSNRCFSTAHAVFIAGASFYLLFFSGLFHRDSWDEFIISRHSTFSNTVLGVSVGYFFTDFGMLLWHFPTLGGKEYLLHHGLSIYSICISVASGQAQFYILMVLLSEFTTPFVNLRWHLDVAGQKNSTLYIVNGIALFLGWLVARVFLFIFIYVHMYHHFDEVKMVFPLGFYSLLIMSPAVAILNLFWFWRIARGLFKILTKARHVD